MTFPYSRTLHPCLILLLGSSGLDARAAAADYRINFGSHRSGPTYGFSISHFDTETSKFSALEFLQPAVAPAYFVLTPDGNALQLLSYKSTALSRITLPPFTQGL
jgi:hypothetical protein